MTILLSNIIPKEQLVIVHSHLPEMEWPGIMEHINATSMGIPVRITQAVKTFFQMVEHRKMWPGMQQRQCTSDLKRGPLQKLIRAICKERKMNLVVNCMGMRADESASRSKLEPFKYVEYCSKAGREWYEWLPIHHLNEEQVFRTITEAGQVPHWVYSKGMRRCSCKICIFSTKEDIKISAKLDPEHAARVVSTERRLNHSFIQPKKGELPKFIDQIISE